MSFGILLDRWRSIYQGVIDGEPVTGLPGDSRTVILNIVSLQSLSFSLICIFHIMIHHGVP